MKTFGPRIHFRNKGLALVVVLWVMAVLVLLATGLAVTVRSEVQVGSFNSSQFRALYLAQAGASYALQALAEDDPSYDGYTEDWAEINSVEEGLEFDNGKFVVHVFDESSKLNLNLASRETLGAFFGNDELADSIVDWRDADSDPLVSGGENDYYAQLPFPYQCKNAPFDTVHELLLVKGMTHELFYEGLSEVGVGMGSGGDSVPLPQLLTVHSGVQNTSAGGIGRVNINTASAEELGNALSDVLAGEQIQAIVNYRDEGSGNGPPSSGFTGGAPLGRQGGFGGGPSGQTGTGGFGGQEAAISSLADLLNVPTLSRENVKDILDRITLTDDEQLDNIVNINTVTYEVLRSLSGMTEQAAQDVIAYREGGSGPFVSVGQLLDLTTLDDTSLEDVLEWASVRSSVFRIVTLGISDYTNSRQVIDSIVVRARPIPEEQNEQTAGGGVQTSVTANFGLTGIESEEVSTSFAVLYQRER